MCYSFIWFPESNLDISGSDVDTSSGYSDSSTDCHSFMEGM